MPHSRRAVWATAGAADSAVATGFPEPAATWRRSSDAVRARIAPSITAFGRDIMLDQDVPLKVAQEILGHTSLMLTADTYSHVTPKLQREATEKLSAMFDKKKHKDRELD